MKQAATGTPANRAFKVEAVANCNSVVDNFELLTNHYRIPIAGKVIGISDVWRGYRVSNKRVYADLDSMMSTNVVRSSGLTRPAGIATRCAAILLLLGCGAAAAQQPEAPRNPPIDAACRSTLLAKNAELQTLLIKYTELHPDVRALRRIIAQIGACDPNQGASDATTREESGPPEDGQSRERPEDAPRPVTPRAAGRTATVNIDAARPLQQIDGFGTSSLVGFEALERGQFDEVVPVGVTYKLSPEQRKALMETAFRELGVTHLRIYLWPPGIEEKNDNEDPHVLDWGAFTWRGKSGQPASSNIFANRGNGIHEWGEFLQNAIRLGLENWILTPGDLPAWMRQGRFDDPNNPRLLEEYAEWAAAHLLYLKKTFGIEAPYWSLANEPDVVLGQLSPQFYIAWIKAIRARFDKEGLKTKIMFPDAMDVYSAVPLVAEVLKDDAARRSIGALAYHHYKSSGDGPQPFIEVSSKAETADSGALFDKITGGARAMAELGRKYGLRSWQTETGYYPAMTKGLTEWEIGRGRANEIHYELTSGASAVQGMSLFWPDAVDSRVGARTRNEGHHILLTTDGKRVSRWEVSKDAGAVFAHYARFVRPGDHRMQVQSNDPMLRITAFASDKNRRHVVVAINNSSASTTLCIRLSNLRWEPGFAGGLITDATRTLASHPIADRRTEKLCYESEVPPQSLATFVWTETDPGPLTLPDHIPKR